MANYVPRVGLIYTKTLTASFVQILTKAQCKTIRGFKIKSRLTIGQAPKWFDIAFVAVPNETGNVNDGTGFLSYSGAGFGDALAASNGLWARTRDPSTTAIVEIITYN